MATLYSSLYGSAPNASDLNIYNGPVGERIGELCVAVGTFEVTVATPLDATNTTMKLMDVVPGFKLIRATLKARTDPDSGTDFTFDLGLESDTDGYVAASTALQGTTGATIGPLALIPAEAAATTFESLVLTRAADATDQAAIVDFIIEFTQI